MGISKDVKYNFTQIERCLTENVVYGKPNIDIQIEMFNYSDDVRSSNKLSLLEEKIEQVRMFIKVNIEHRINSFITLLFQKYKRL